MNYSPNPDPGVIGASRISRLSATPAVGRIGDHGQEGRRARVFGDEGQVPDLVGGAGDHRLRPSRPHLPAADPGEHLGAVPAIGAIGVQPAHPLAVVGMVGGIFSQGLQPDQIQHLDRRVARQGLERLELRTRGIDRTCRHDASPGLDSASYPLNTRR
jgi:hypothetical protein